MKAFVIKKFTRNGRQLSVFIALIAAALILASDGRYSAVVLKGINLWAAIVLPSLFPYFFITATLSSLSITERIALKLSPLSRRLFNTGGITAYALFISLISGYPVGAKMVCDLYEKALISKSECVRAGAFCSTPSPMFLIGSVGGTLFEKPSFGLCLFVCSFLSAIVIGFIFSFYHRNDRPIGNTATAAYHSRQTSQSTRNDTNANGKASLDGVVFECAFSAVFSVLKVGGIIVLFYLFTEMLYNLGALNLPINAIARISGSDDFARGIIFGLFECTRGLNSLSVCEIGLPSLAVCAGVCGFGGLSVICQSLAYLTRAGVKPFLFIGAKVLSAALNVLFALTLGGLFL